jgi:nicotinamidase-related amidase
MDRIMPKHLSFKYMNHLNNKFLPKSLSQFVQIGKVALIMWDMQNGLAGKAHNLEQIRTNANLLLDAADRNNVPVFWSKHILPSLSLTTEPFLLFLMKKQKVDDPHLLVETMKIGMEDAKYIEGLEPRPGHIVLEKSQPSFFIDTPLDLRLKTLGIKTLVFAGVATDIGIEFTCRHGASLGYFSVVAEDACGSYTDLAHQRSLDFLRSWITPVVKAQEIVDVWDN